MGGIALVLSNSSLDRQHKKEQVNRLPFQLLSGINQRIKMKSQICLSNDIFHAGVLNPFVFPSNTT